MKKIQDTHPNLILAGVHKAGTTSLYTYLAKHPDICASSTKEVGYFYPLIFGRPVDPIENYFSHFKHCYGSRYRMEASPSYLYGGQTVASAIRRTLPDAKILILLRNPTDRLISYYHRAVSKATVPDNMTLNEFVNKSIADIDSESHSVVSRGVREGLYMRFLKAWHKIFDDQLKILFFDDLAADTRSLTIDTCNWLGIGNRCYSEDDFSVENKTLQYRSLGIHQVTRKAYLISERFWRRHQGLKKQLRSFYNLVNSDGQPQQSPETQRARARLDCFYSEHNRELSEYLSELGYLRLPVWLDSPSPVKGRYASISSA